MTIEEFIFVFIFIVTLIYSIYDIANSIEDIVD